MSQQETPKKFFFCRQDYPQQFFKDQVQENGHVMFDRMMILHYYMGGGHKLSCRDFCSKFKAHKQYKEESKQPWFKHGLMQGRGEKFILNTLENVIFTKRGIVIQDFRENNRRPYKFQDGYIKERAMEQLTLQDDLNYSQFKYWSHCTNPGEISHSQYTERVKKFIGTGNWSKNDKILLKQAHKEHRFQFVDYLSFGGKCFDEKFYSILYDEWRYPVYQDEAWFPSNTPLMNPQQKHRYDLKVPESSIGQKPVVSKNTPSFMYKIIYIYIYV